MYVLMKCVAEAVMAKGIRGLADLVPGGGFLFEVAKDAVKRLRERRREDELREEVRQTANAAIDEAKRVAKEVAKEVAADAPVEDRLTLEMYLTQIPGAVRQSLKRVDDPTGTTVPPNFAMEGAGDLTSRLPQRAPRFRPGAPLPGKPGWHLVELLGAGGFGEVWLAANPALAALKGAVKFSLDPQARDRLLRHEGALVSRVMEQGRRPNVVALLDAHLEGDAPWLMYEYVSGGDLTGLILSWQSLTPAERVTRTTAALHTLAATVGHFHRLTPPLVHRDLKPANILLQVEGRQVESRQVEGGAATDVTTLRPDDFRLCIADFGIGGVASAAALAHTAGAGRPGSTGFLLSQLSGAYTPLYACPQQQAGAPPDPRDDIHALGVIGFQMLTGRLDATLGADYAKTLRRLGVPEPLIELLGDCAAHEADHRPRDGAELADRLAKLTPAAPAPPVPAPVQAPAASGTEVKCPKCSATLKVPATATGRRVKCPACQHVIEPPSTSPPKPEPQPAKPITFEILPGGVAVMTVPLAPSKGTSSSSGEPRPVAKPVAPRRESPDREEAPRTAPKPPPPRRGRGPWLLLLGGVLILSTAPRK